MGFLMNINTIEVLGGVIVALLGFLTAIVEKGRRAAKNAEQAASVAAKSVEVVREQVQNSHPKNLRDEQDDRHWEILANQKESLGVQAEILAAVRALREEDGRLFDLIVGNTQDIREIQKARKGRQTKGDTQ